MALTAGLLLQHKHVDPLSVNFCLLKPLQLVFHLDLNRGALKVVQSCPDSNFNRYGQAEFSFVYFISLVCGIGRTFELGFIPDETKSRRQFEENRVKMVKMA